MHILVVNAGSSSLKLRVLDEDDELVAAADAAGPDDPRVRAFLDGCESIGAVGHRVVHGGHRYIAPVQLDDAVVADLDALTPLAPVHQPLAVAAIRALHGLLPTVPAVACFDTAFHAGIPAAASTYPLPLAWRDEFGLRRFGFHGLSHAYAARRTREILGDPPRRLITCHLGAGSSICGIVDRHSVDTTMGFTPNEGVPMATRSGSVDVGMLMWLLHQGISVDDLDHALQHESGLLALGRTGDMQTIERAAASGDPRAQLAIDVWLHRVTQAIASMAVSTGGIDAITFTGGIGENAVGLRRGVADRLGWLGVHLDPAADAAAAPDRLLSSPDAALHVLVVASREDIEIARGVRQLLSDIR